MKGKDSRQLSTNMVSGANYVIPCQTQQNNKKRDVPCSPTAPRSPGELTNRQPEEPKRDQVVRILTLYKQKTSKAWKWMISDRNFFLKQPSIVLWLSATLVKNVIISITATTKITQEPISICTFWTEEWWNCKDTNTHVQPWMDIKKNCQ